MLNYFTQKLNMKTSEPLKIKTRSTYAEPELANITRAEWINIVRREAEKHNILPPVTCPDYIRLLNSTR